MRRLALLYLVLLLLFILAPPGPGLHAQTDEELKWHGVTILKTRTSISKLNAIANDRDESIGRRSQAVAELFANYVKPGMSPKDLHSVLTNTAWLKDSEFISFSTIAGYLPLEYIPPICLLTPFKSRWSKSPARWLIWFTFNGPKDENFERDALAFLKGQKLESNQWALHEFLVGFPSTRQSLPGRSERFGSKGLHVYSDDSQLFAPADLHRFPLTGFRLRVF